MAKAAEYTGIDAMHYPCIRDLKMSAAGVWLKAAETVIGSYTRSANDPVSTKTSVLHRQ